MRVRRPGLGRKRRDRRRRCRRGIGGAWARGGDEERPRRRTGREGPMLERTCQGREEPRGEPRTPRVSGLSDLVTPFLPRDVRGPPQWPHRERAGAWDQKWAPGTSGARHPEEPITQTDGPCAVRTRIVRGARPGCSPSRSGPALPRRSSRANLARRDACGARPRPEIASSRRRVRRQVGRSARRRGQPSSSSSSVSSPAFTLRVGS